MSGTDTSRTGDLPLIGAQLSSAGGFRPVPQRAVDIGAEVVQIFNTNPRTWRPRLPAPEEIEAFAAELRRHRLRLFFHSTYLINLASPDEELRRRSSEALALALTTGALAGAEAVVTHIGSHRGEATAEAGSRVVQSVSAAATLAERSVAALPALLLETGTGAGNTMGGRLEEIAALLSLEQALGLARTLSLGICIDTAHLFAAGYAVHEEAGLEGMIERLRALGLLERIGLVHLNDSKTPFGVRRDQHENLGEGLIGYEGLARVVRHPALAHVPFVLEVPGADGHGPDAANLALARSMRGNARKRPQADEAAPVPPTAPAPAGTGRERPE
jgi:deoxyribonuclease IV